MDNVRCSVLNEAIPNSYSFTAPNTSYRPKRPLSPTPPFSLSSGLRRAASLRQRLRQAGPSRTMALEKFARSRGSCTSLTTKSEPASGLKLTRTGNGPKASPYDRAILLRRAQLQLNRRPLQPHQGIRITHNVIDQTVFLGFQGIHKAVAPEILLYLLPGVAGIIADNGK